jgi:hypothetical protein
MFNHQHLENVSHELTYVNALVEWVLVLEEVCCKTNVDPTLLDAEILSDEHFEYS